MELTECFETSAHRIQTPGKHPKERLQYSEEDESLKSRICMFMCIQRCWEVLSPTRQKKQLKGRHFSSDAEFIAASETWLGGQTSELFLSELQ